MFSLFSGAGLPWCTPIGPVVCPAPGMVPAPFWWCLSGSLGLLNPVSLIQLSGICISVLYMPPKPNADQSKKKDRASEPASLRPARVSQGGNRPAVNSPTLSPKDPFLFNERRLRSESTGGIASKSTPDSPTKTLPPLGLEKVQETDNATQQASTEADATNSSDQSVPAKKRCPCKTSSNGKSWLMTCNSCEQAWHNGCANLKGDKLTKEAVSSILKGNWQCPWCYVPAFPCPKKHKAAKAKASFENIAYANEFLAKVVDSLDTMVDTKLTEVLQTNTASIEAIGKQLDTLSKEISDFKSTPVAPLSIPAQAISHQPPPSFHPVEPIQAEDSSLNHGTNYIEDFVEDFITPEEESGLIDLLDSQTFVKEGSRGVLQFGQYYKYMGSKTSPKACPEIIKKLMDKLNEEHAKKHQDSRLHYDINSCLVNKYEGNVSHLPEHSDNEGDICPWSSIFTISLGATRTVVFRNTQDNVETPVYCNSKSLYQMTRHSQDFFKHQIKPEPEQDDSIRYSLTFRSIHWSNFNSTLLVGDSNFGKIQFGVGKGKVGQATPGFRSFVPQVADIDPISCTPFRNVVIMAGTNDLKKDMTEKEILELYRTYKTKVSQIRKYNPRCRLFVCPVLPTKSSVINKRIFRFNKFICDDLLQSDMHALLVEGFLEFVDNNTSLLKGQYSVNDSNDILHINSNKGVRLLVSLIKQAIFGAKMYDKTVNHRTFANVTRGGPVDPI